MKPLAGRLFFHSETGTEGGWWAFHEDGKEGYDGLHVLKDGDHLTIWNPHPFNPAKRTLLWNGEIRLKFYPPFTEHAWGYWINADQEGVERGFWARWFFDELPAELVKKEDR